VLLGIWTFGESIRTALSTMRQVLDISALDDWDAKMHAVRDYLNAGHVTPLTQVELTFGDGHSVVLRHPRLASMTVPPPADEAGEYPPDTHVLVIDLPDATSSIGWTRLESINSIDLKRQGRLRKHLLSGSAPRLSIREDLQFTPIEGTQ
jgi:hypothetical protein